MPPDPALSAAALYAGLNGLILLALAAHVGRMRGRLNIMMGDGGNPLMIRAMRGQANFVEYTPLVLIQLVVMALIGTPAWVVHLGGLALTLGRVLHGWHFVQDDAPGWQRGAGAGLTMLALVVASLGLIGHGLARMVAG
jgi:uncharacterized membrane protein YecN with MAPEG domain